MGYEADFAEARRFAVVWLQRGEEEHVLKRETVLLVIEDVLHAGHQFLRSLEEL